MKRLLITATTILLVGCSHDAVSPQQAPSPRSPLVVVDGREIPIASLDELDRLAVERVEVVKGAAAVTRYGERGRHGVILVTTKSGY